MRKNDNLIDLTKEQKTLAADMLKEFLLDSFDVEIGGLQASIMLDFITEKLGPLYYNKAVADAQAFITEKTEDMFLLMKDE